jgi:hypothetical protein
MAYSQTKNPYLGKFWRVLQWERLVYFMIIWSILGPFVIFCGPLVYFMFIWYIFPRFGMLHKKNLATLRVTQVRRQLRQNQPWAPERPLRRPEGQDPDQPCQAGPGEAERAELRRARQDGRRHPGNDFMSLGRKLFGQILSSNFAPISFQEKKIIPLLQTIRLD